MSVQIPEGASALLRRAAHLEAKASRLREQAKAIIAESLPVEAPEEEPPVFTEPVDWDDE